MVDLQFQRTPAYRAGPDAPRRAFEPSTAGAPSASSGRTLGRAGKHGVRHAPDQPAELASDPFTNPLSLDYWPLHPRNPLNGPAAIAQSGRPSTRHLATSQQEDAEGAG